VLRDALRSFALPIVFLFAAILSLNADPVVIGSKKFTESYVLAEIAKRTLTDSGIPAEHREGMGGTIILWQALRTQQIIAHETGVANTVDPLGGSYFVETLTNEVERGAWDYIHKIDAMGGMVTAIERSYPQREIAEASYRYQMEVDRKDKIVVGVNDFVTKESPLEILQIDETVAHRQAERLRKLRADRSQAEVDRRLNTLRTAARGKENLMPFIYDTVKAYATLGEICEAMRDVFGTYEEVAIT